MKSSWDRRQPKGAKGEFVHIHTAELDCPRPLYRAQITGCSGTIAVVLPYRPLPQPTRLLSSFNVHCPILLRVFTESAN